MGRNRLGIERPGVGGKRMNHQPANADRIGRLDDAVSDVANQCASGPFSLNSAIHGQSPEHDDGNGIRHVATEPA